MRVDMVMPQMGESITEGTVVRWTKKVGDLVARDENVLDISTDKVDSEIPSPAAGRLVEIRAQEGETIPVGQVIAVIETEVGAAVPAAPAPSVVASAVPAAAPAPASVAAPVARTPVPVPTPAASIPSSTGAAEPAGGPIPRRDGDRFYSPLVRSMARTEGVSAAELAAIPGTGRGGRVTSEDVTAFVAARGGQLLRPGAPPAVASAAAAAANALRAASPVSVPPASTGAPAPRPAPAIPSATPAAEAWEAISGGAFAGLAAGMEVAFKPYPAITVAETRPTPDGAIDVVRMDTMRQRIAEHMVRSKATSPHVASVTEVDLTRVVRHRESAKADFESKYGFKLTYTPFIVAATVRALLDYPMMNASIEGTDLLVRRYVNLGVAVALDHGLIVPVVKHAEEKNFLGLARAISDLAARARSKKLVPDDVAGGTFAVTNMGSFGNLFGIPIINQPNAGILGAGAIVKRPVVVGDAIAIRDIMYLSLSYDHRIVDGALGGYFIQRVRYYLERVDLAGGV